MLAPEKKSNQFNTVEWVRCNKMSIDIDKEYYYFVQYMEIKLKHEYQKKLNKADKVSRKQIKNEHQQKWTEFCETNKLEYEAYLRVKSRMRMKLYCLLCCA